MENDQHEKETVARLLKVTSQVWLVISVGWFISIFLGFVNVYIAYGSWILWPNLVAVWGNHKRRLLMADRK